MQYLSGVIGAHILSSNIFILILETCTLLFPSKLLSPNTNMDDRTLTARMHILIWPSVIVRRQLWSPAKVMTGFYFQQNSKGQF